MRSLLCLMLGLGVAIGPAYAGKVSRWLRTARRYEKRKQCKKALKYYNRALAYRRLSKRTKRRIQKKMRWCIAKLAPKPIGPLNGPQIQRVVNSRHTSIYACYIKGLFSNSSLTGKVTVQFSINRAGRVSDCRVVKSTMNSRNVEYCIETTVAKIVFPRNSNRYPISVQYPLIFKKSDAKMFRTEK